MIVNDRSAKRRKRNTVEVRFPVCVLSFTDFIRYKVQCVEVYDASQIHGLNCFTIFTNKIFIIN